MKLYSSCNCVLARTICIAPIPYSHNIEMKMRKTDANDQQICLDASGMVYKGSGHTIWVEDFRNKANGWRLLGISLCECEGKSEYPILPNGPIWPKDYCVPFHYIVWIRGSIYADGWLRFDCTEVTNKPLQRQWLP
jgi:hypothetical protein